MFVPVVRRACPAFVLIAAMLLVSSRGAAAEVVRCEAAPPPTASVTTSVSPGSAETPATINVLWPGVVTIPEQVVTSYVVEFGTSPGGSEIAVIDTGWADRSYSHPAGNGTYYVRIRSKNACGISRPSPETKVVVEGGMPFGEPGVRPVSATTVVTSDERGNVRVTGEVRSAFGSRPAGFIKVTATFAGARDTTAGTEFTYVQGRTRRGRLSRVIDDSTLGGSESACYVIRTSIPISLVTGVSAKATWSTAELEPLRGGAAIVELRSALQGIDDLGISGQLRNTGPDASYFNRVTLDIRDARNRVVECNDAYVEGVNVRLSGGVATDTALASDQAGNFRDRPLTRFSAMMRFVSWTASHEADLNPTTVPANASWQSLLQDLGHLLHNDPVGRARERNAAIERLRQLVGDAPK